MLRRFSLPPNLARIMAVLPAKPWSDARFSRRGFLLSDRDNGLHWADAVSTDEGTDPSFLVVTFDDGLATFTPTPWLSECPEIADGQDPALAPPPPHASEESERELRTLLAREIQRELARHHLVRMDGIEGPADAWLEVVQSARRLGMVLGEDKALVRLALAPLLAKRGLDGFMEARQAHESGLVKTYGLFVLRHAPTDTILGQVARAEGEDFPDGCVILGIDAAMPAVLTYDEASDLARQGRHTAGTRDLATRKRLPPGALHPLLCGIQPAALVHSPRHVKPD